MFNYLEFPLKINDINYMNSFLFCSVWFYEHLTKYFGDKHF